MFRISVAAAGLMAVLLTSPAQAALRINEIMYHPVEKAAFDAAGDPVMDLSDDVHEFVEIYNPDGAAMDVSGWKLGGGVSYTFPAGTVMAAGGYQVVARNPVRLAAVGAYGLTPAQLLGPWSGGLNNGGDTVRLENAGGVVVDSVSYSSQSPWAAGADALGADDEWTGLSSAAFQYRGRSLERVSLSASSNDSSNWLASPVATGPSPGRANAVTRAVPLPIVLTQSAVQDSTNLVIIRASQQVRVDAQFSAAGTGAAAVKLEYFKDDINSTSEAASTLDMSGVAGAPGKFTALIPGQLDRSVIRYRIKADRGGGSEVVSPRTDDPFVWHACFVTPVRAVSANPVYDIFIATAGVTQLNTNITQSPRRITLPDPPGTPRASWNATQPAIVVRDGIVFDARIRYHGSRYNRSAARKSYKWQFPRYAMLDGREGMYMKDKGEEHRLGFMLYTQAGLPAPKTRYADLYQNTDAKLVRLECDEMDDILYRRWADERAAALPGTPRENVGEFYKATGVIPYETGSGQNTVSVYAQSGEGPYYIGNCAVPPPKPGWTTRQRFDWTYGLQMHTWIGGRDMEQLLTGLWAVRGDSPTAPSMNIAAVRAWLAANFDVDAMLNYMAIRDWSAPFDNATHNHFLWRKAIGRWAMLAWDLDVEFQAGRAGQTIFWDEQTNPQPDTLRGPEWAKDSFYKAFRNEYKQKLFTLNNTLLTPANLTALGMGGFSGYATSRQTNVNTQLGMGTFYRPQTPAAVAPAAGASVLTGAALQASAYAHTAPEPPAHASTTWMIRAAAGSYAAPVFRATSTASLTSLPIPFDDLVFGQTYYWTCIYTDIDGHPSATMTERAFVFGSTGIPAGAVRLNEIAADDASGLDYIEISNTSAAAVDISGMGVTDDPATGAKTTVPGGTTLMPNEEFLFCLHSGSAFQLAKEGETVLLLSAAGALLDSVTFGLQARGYSIGRDASGTWELQAVSPGAPNTPAPAMGGADALRLNEWMASDSSGPDWFEIYNTGADPVALAGLKLTNGIGTTAIAPLSFAGGGACVRFIADKDPEQGPDHVDFRLSAGGETISLQTAAGATLDTVEFGPQTADVSGGRLPNGSATLTTFGGDDASPGEPNARVAATLRITRIDPGTSSVTITNPGAIAVNMTGWWLSNDTVRPQNLALSGMLAGGAATTVVVGPSVSVNKVLGGEVVLTNADGSQRQRARYGPNGPYAYRPHESLEYGYQLLDPATGNPYAVPLTLSEIMYHPPNAPGDEQDYEFVELAKLSAPGIDISGWKLRGGLDCVFPAGTVLNGFLVVTPAHPDTFRQVYDLPATATAIQGMAEGSLDNSGGTVRLIQTLPAIHDGSCYDGYAPEIPLITVHYDDNTPWPLSADGNGDSLAANAVGPTPSTAAGWSAKPPSPLDEFAGNNAPTVSVTGPAAGASLGIGVPVSLTAVAADSRFNPALSRDFHVTAVEFFVDGARAGFTRAEPYAITWVPLLPGAHTIMARAWDGYLAHTDSAPVNITVVNNAPVVTLTSPEAGALFTAPVVLNLAAMATDGDGGVTDVQFIANGLQIGHDTTEPYTLTWPATLSGNVQFFARAIDGYGLNADSPPVSVFIIRGSGLVYTVPAGTVGTQNYGGGLGHDFNVVQPIVVTKLGIFDSSGNGISASLGTAIFVRSGNTGTLRASMMFTAADPGALMPGTAQRLKPLATPLILQPGSYTTASYWHNDTDRNGNLGTGSAYVWTRDDAGGAIVFTGTARHGTSVPPVGSFVFPVQPDGGPVDRYAGPTFEYQTMDADGDGMPWDWETANGFNPIDSADASADADGDGQSNAAEYAAATNPGDAASRFILTSHALTGGQQSLTFTAQANRRYRIERSFDLSPPNWIAVETIEPAGTIRTIPRTIAAPDRREFYRVVATPP